MRHLIVSILLVSAVVAPIGAKETVAKEAKLHPRIEDAITSIEAAIKELKDSPHDFGGHKQEAIEACHKAEHQLRLALEHRAKEDNKK